jgi:hypothetical protein
MTHSFFRGICPSLLLAAWLGGVGCSGTNTGNGMTAGTPSTGGAPGGTGGVTGGVGGVTGGTGGAPQYCPSRPPCSGPVNLTGSDGRTYRGWVYPDVTIASDSHAASVANPPVAMLTFVGGEIDDSDAGCREVMSFGFPEVHVYVAAADSSIDAFGTLHVHSAARSDNYGSGPTAYPGWAVDLAVTADGQLTATLSLAVSSGLDAGAGAGAGGAGAGEGGAGGVGAMQELELSGRIEPSCVAGPDGGLTPASIPVSGGGTFNLPCWQRTGCEG